MKNLGGQIRQLRVNKGMTQGELALAVNSTVSSISNYERGKRTPPYPVVYSICEVLGVPITDLLKYMTDNDGNAENISAENPVDKRPRRVKRLMSAFDRLSDAAQMEIIEFAERLNTMPMYSRTLPGTLQYYICNRDHLMYQLAEDTGAPKPGVSNPLSGYPDKVQDIRRITFYNDDDPKSTCYCDFFYYEYAGPIEDEFVNQKISYILSMVNPMEPTYRLGFVFDDQESLDCFYSSYENKQEQPELDWAPGKKRIPALFLMIDKETLEIKDSTYYNPDEY